MPRKRDQIKDLLEKKVIPSPFGKPSTPVSERPALPVEKEPIVQNPPTPQTPDATPQQPTSTTKELKPRQELKGDTPLGFGHEQFIEQKAENWFRLVYAGIGYGASVYGDRSQMLGHADMMQRKGEHNLSAYSAMKAEQDNGITYARCKSGAIVKDIPNHSAKEICDSFQNGYESTISPEDTQKRIDTSQNMILDASTIRSYVQ